MSIVSIIGFGNVGATIGFLLVNKLKEPLTINIIEPDPRKEGTILDISHTLSNNTQHVIVVNDYNLLAKSAFVFHTAGKVSDPDKSRLTLLKENVELTYQIFEPINFVADPYIMVITNPVDVICHHVKVASGVSSDRIFSTGTFLDSKRFAFYLSKNLNNPFSKIQSWFLGEHGDSMVPIYSHTTADGILIEDVMQSNDHILSDCVKQTIESAYTIKATQRATFYGVASCAVEIFNMCFSHEKKLIPLSVPINEHYKKMFELDKDIFISLPVYINNRSIKVCDHFELNNQELKRLKKSAKIIAGNTF